MKTIIIDNYDSFTFNLRHLVRVLGEKTDTVDVVRNDRFSIEDLASYDKIILSPGPGIPSEAGLLTEVIREYAPKKPILGVCLGHQAIGEVFGAGLINLSTVYHGVATPVALIDNSHYIFEGLPDRFEVGRYHSWVVERESLPECLLPTAMSDEGLVMAIRHREYDVNGIQFHPESVLTPKGATIIKNFLKR